MSRFVGGAWERDLAGRWAVITGASSGIGKMCASALLSQNCSVILVARDQDRLAKVKSEFEEHHSNQVEIVVGDIADSADVSRIANVVADFVGKKGVYVLVNSAGIASKGSVLEADPLVWASMIDLNVRGLMLFTRAVAPLMKLSDGGAIVNVGSDMALKWSANQGAYCASKAAVTAFTRCIYEDMREFGVKVSVLMPGIVNTPLQGGRAGIRFEYCIQAEDVARLALFVVNFPGTSCPTELVIEPQRSPYVQS